MNPASALGALSKAIPGLGQISGVMNSVKQASSNPMSLMQGALPKIPGALSGINPTNQIGAGTAKASGFAAIPSGGLAGGLGNVAAAPVNTALTSSLGSNPVKAATDVGLGSSVPNISDFS